MSYGKTSTRSFVLCAFVTLVACSERTPTRSAQPAAPSAPRSAGSATLTAPPARGSLVSPAPSASTLPPASSAAVPPEARASEAPFAEPELETGLDGDGKPLPQTEERPRVDSPAFLERMRRLVAAIRTDDPEVARAAFFPVVAYEQVKAIAHPARDWERRLYAAFQRNVHEYHRSLGASAGTLEFVGVDVPEATSRWMKPGSEGNRVGYHRVLRSRLRVKDGAGRERALELTSMISWRGEWYVVHLHGFK